MSEPLTLGAAPPLSTPGRDVLLFITFGVILVTLVGQGLAREWPGICP